VQPREGSCYTLPMKLVVASGALLVVALIGLALMLTASPADPPSAPVAPPAQRAAAPPPPAPAPQVETVSPSARPATQPADSKPVADVYRVDGVIVHDYTGRGERRSKPPDFTPPEGARLPPQLANDVTTAVEPAAQACLSELPAASRTEATRLSVTMTVAVKNGSLTVRDVAAKVRDLDESVLAKTLDCLRGRMIGTSVDASGQADVPSYLISTSYFAK
jgi:hypothetical protein